MTAPYAASGPVKLVAVIANVEPEEIAARLQAAKLDGYVYGVLGFGSWGTEPACRIDSTTDRLVDFLQVVADLLRAHGETCAYVEINGRPYLLDQARNLSPIE